MFAYHLDLALRSFRSARGLTALMVLAIAMGIGACMTTLTVLRTLSADPIPGRSGWLLRVQLDVGPGRSLVPGHEPDDQLTRFDAETLMQARRATRQAMMTGGGIAIEPGADAPGAPKPFITDARYTTADFFAMFATPFRAGGPWSAADDAAHAQVAVITRSLGERLFGAADPLGRTLRASGSDYRIVGVLDAWQPVPYFFDPNVGNFRRTEDVFIPFSTALDRKLGSHGNMRCWGDNPVQRPHERDAPCSWIQYWVELDTAEDRAAYLDYLRNYSDQQRAAGRFERPTNVRLRSVPEWLAYKRIVPEDVRLQAWLAFGFLVVCLVNTVGLLLAKCLRRAPEIGVRRALGASRRQIFAQFVVEAGAIGIAGGIGGFALAALGVWLIRLSATTAHAGFVHVDAFTFGATFALALAATVLAGLLPAWRACTVTPASQLKSA
jgi:putative ABC transport system permease protein